jgi:5-methylcytosine-specific restriction endonuclease McrA
MVHVGRDRENYRRWHRERNARIRAEWIAANGPCTACGSSVDLEVDHVDPRTKDPLLRRGTGLWTWSKARREAELAKCQVLCQICHVKKTTDEQQAGALEHGPRCKKRGCHCEVSREYERQKKRESRERLKQRGVAQ